MPAHDWTRVIAGIFHHFHQRWVIAISDTLNAGVLPTPYYALAEQVAEGPIPDVLTLKAGESDFNSANGGGIPSGAIAIAATPPKVEHVLEADAIAYAQKSTRVGIRHASDDCVVAYIEIVSSGNKHSTRMLSRLLDKLADAMERGCHLLVIDLYPPGPSDPRGVHARFWEDYFGQVPSPGVTAVKPLSLAAYRSDVAPTAYLEPFAVGSELPAMPLFLTSESYVNVPLEQSYMEAFAHVPERWRRVIEGSR